MVSAAMGAAATAALCLRCPDGTQAPPARPSADLEGRQETGSSEAAAVEIQPGLVIANPTLELADDEALARACECPREVYVEGDQALRKAFAPATIVKVLRGEVAHARYADGGLKYSPGTLTVGQDAPDFDVLEVRRGAGVDLFSVDHLRPTQLLAPLRREGRRHVVLDFGSFS